VGSFFAFCARHDFPVPYYFARVIVSHIIYKKESIPPELYVFNYLADEDPGRVQGVKRLLTHPEEIEYSYIYMNDEFNLDGTGAEVEVTDKTFFDYLHKLSEHKFTKQLTKDKAFTNVILDAFIQGFYLGKKLQDLRITTREFDKLLCGTPITINSIRDWVRERADHIRYAANSQHERQIIAWFKEIMREMEHSPEFPAGMMDTVLEASPTPSKSRSRKRRVKAFVEFFMRLMKFWTGFRKLDMSANYTVNFERDNGLPTSHMCFNTLCLPRNVRSKENLYELLVTSALEVEPGAGNY
jgi:hypothetical protein